MTKLISVLLAAVVSTTAHSAGDMVQSDIAYKMSLEGKSIAFVGDSICYGANYSGGYGKLIGEQNNMIVTNCGVDAITLARNESVTGSKLSIVDTVEALEGEYDYIIVEGGINDSWKKVPLDSLTDGFDGGYDESTVTGAMESIFYSLKQNHPESKLGFVIAHDHLTYDGEAEFAPYYETIKAVCEKWSISYIDLYAANNPWTGINVKDPEINRLYFGSEKTPEGDGCHPNELGYQVIYVDPMVVWLKTL